MGREEDGGETVNGGGKCQRERGTEMRLGLVWVSKFLFQVSGNKTLLL